MKKECLTYEEFMEGVKRKSKLPFKLSKKPYNGGGYLTKLQTYNLVCEGKIKINYKPPHIVCKGSGKTCSIPPRLGRFKKMIFEAWWKVYKSKTIKWPCNDMHYKFNPLYSWTAFINYSRNS